MAARREFTGIDDQLLGELDDQQERYTTRIAPSSSMSCSSPALLLSIRENIIGTLKPFESPYGKMPCVYADWTASGRGLRNIESYIINEILPLYGNTHTSTSITGHQSTCFRHEARQIIAQSVNAKITGRAAEDVVIFTGNGTTAAISKLVASLGLHLPLPEELKEDITSRPVVFTSSYEHHSNLLPWRECVADVFTVRYHPTTGVDLQHLQELLAEHKDRKLKIGTFSAASNVTGILTAVNEVALICHQHGALAFFDYATAAPYVKIDMNPVDIQEGGHLMYKDAVIFSGHKFLGGPGTPGVLIVKRRILPQNDAKPTNPGGGTVFYVTDEHHRYLSNKEEREEGGTPFVIGDIRLGLVMQLKNQLGISFIQQEESRISMEAFNRLSSHPKIVVLGRRGDVGRQDLHLPIFSFLIKQGSRFLHYNFVCALLNDLFGVQIRGGCQCAGPFSQDLLGITPENNHRLELALLDKHEVLRPGYSRFSLPYWMAPEEINYILECIEFVANSGHHFLESYRYNPKTGEWAHTSRITRFPNRKWISNFDFLSLSSPSPTSLSPVVTTTTTTTSTLSPSGKPDDDCDKYEVFRVKLSTAKDELSKIMKSKKRNRSSLSSQPESDLKEVDDLRWFALREDDQEDYTNGGGDSGGSMVTKGPIQPHVWNPIDSGKIRSASDRVDKLKEQGTLYAHKQSKEKHIARTSSLSASESVFPRYVSAQAENLVPTATGPSANPLPASKVIDHHLQQQYLGSPASISMTEGPVCSIRKKTNPTDPNLLTEEKVLAGEGTTYLPINGVNGGENGNGNRSVKIHQPPKKILKYVGQAIQDWNMINDGDRLLLGLSGGKDSLALLHILLAVQKKAPVKFTVSCATVDPQTDSFDPSPLIPYVQSLGVTYHYLSEPIVELAKTKLQGDSLCAFCSRFKRGLLYSCCRKNNYNKLVLAQHLDDLAESFFMSALHNGQIRTMKANYKIDAGDCHVIRPLAYVREQMTRDFSVACRLPIINENCPACFEQPKERDRVKKLLKQEEAMVPALFHNLKKALLPLMANETYFSMDKIIRDIEVRQKMEKNTSSSKQDRDCRINEKNQGTKTQLRGKRDRDDDEARKVHDVEIDNGVKIENLPTSTFSGCSKDGGYCPPCYELC